MENFYVNYAGGSDSYANTMAALTRAQYSDYVERFQPIENDLIGLATSDELYKKQIARNQENAALNYAQADAAQAAASSKYGLGDQRTEQQKTNLGLTRALGLSSMNNESRQAIGDLQRDIITGQASGSKQQINQLGSAK
ncbi:TPA: hypothetical protein ACOJPC_003119 [Vibrio fluvialis]